MSPALEESRSFAFILELGNAPGSLAVSSDLKQRGVSVSFRKCPILGTSSIDHCEIMTRDSSFLSFYGKWRRFSEEKKQNL